MKIRSVALIGLPVVILIGAAVWATVADRSWMQDIGPSSPFFFAVVAVAAFVDSINPCAFSVLLLTIAFLFSAGRSVRNIRSVGLVYVSAIFLVYILIGVGILGTFELFGVSNVVGRAAAVLLIILGAINIINDLVPSFPIKLKIPEASHTLIARFIEKGSMPAAFVLGAIVAVTEFPCTGGPYLLILSMLHGEGSYLVGLLYLAFYNLVFVAPLIVILLTASNPAMLEAFMAWKKRETRSMKLFGGIAMVLLGALLFGLY